VVEKNSQGYSRFGNIYYINHYRYPERGVVGTSQKNLQYCKQWSWEKIIKHLGKEKKEICRKKSCTCSFYTVKKFD
jgi:deoxyhypusine synthase